MTVGSQLDIRRLQIAMDDALFMRGFERLCDLERNRKDFVDRHRTAGDPFAESRTVDEFEDQSLNAISFLEAVDASDVRVIEQREDLRFALEAGEALGVEHKGLWQNLQGDVAIQHRVARPIHVSHPAGTDGVLNLVIAEAGAR